MLLAAVLWLRIDERGAVAASKRFSDSNVFFANLTELNAGNYAVWAKPWFKYRPGARAEVVAGGERFVIEINSHGFRTREFAVPKPAGMVRIACIGSSTTVAGRTNEETYPALLEKRLRQRYPGLPLEVLNLGVSGVTSHHWLERIDRVFAFQPDIVVQYDAINDISWWDLPRYAKAHPWRRLAASSLLFERFFPLPAEELRPYLQETMDTFKAIARRCREREVAYLAGSFAGPDPRRVRGDFARHLDISTEFWGRRFPMHRYGTLAAMVALHNRLFLEFVHREHVTNVLVHEKLGDPNLFIDTCHFTPEGISLLADQFVPAAAGLVEGSVGYRQRQTGS